MTSLTRSGHSFNCRGRHSSGALARVPLVPLLLLALLFTSCEPPRESAASTSSSSPSDDALVLVRLGKLERGEISSRLLVSADLEAVEKADFYPEIALPVLGVAHRVGDRVKKGETVLSLADEELNLALENKRILLSQARGKVLQADVARREGLHLVEQKKLRLERARSEYDRARALSENPENGTISIVSREAAEAKRFDRDQADLDYQTQILLKEKYELEHSQTLDSEKLAEVEVKTAEFNLSQTDLRSPIDGFITYLTVKPGELVTAATRVFTVVNTDKLEAWLHVPQKELSHLRTGLSVRILCEVFPEKEFQGLVEVVNPVVDRDNGTVEVIVSVADSDSFLKPGMFINGEIILDVHEEALLVPKKAVSYENQEPIIYLVDEDDIAHRFVMKPGFSNRDNIEVLALTGSDGEPENLVEQRLVIVGHNNLQDGSPIEVE